MTRASEERPAPPPWPAEPVHQLYPGADVYVSPCETGSYTINRRTRFCNCPSKRYRCKKGEDCKHLAAADQQHTRLVWEREMRPLISEEAERQSDAAMAAYLSKSEEERKAIFA